ncbi:hypothetical protein DYB37_013189 [Aphanomyces astaci]|uniref:GTP cyclohydrolase II n=3 Tax=Aphanomyces astaci TaxID=112090 RepID=A0A3L6UYH1_APHAT|nr:hypothetical protein DYB35_013723 [Aphanomyces astaci]RHZ13428.1 hypothetical protein DYB37_013189 [Aphanomyces astaci]RLO01527.1 hypothetical protein DYB28_015575 [Aphanomyces astaci]
MDPVARPIKNAHGHYAQLASDHVSQAGSGRILRRPSPMNMTSLRNMPAPTCVEPLKCCDLDKAGLTGMGCGVSTSFVSAATLPTSTSEWRMHAFRSQGCRRASEPIALVYGDVEDNMYVRVHDQCVTSEVFGSLRCDCKEQFDHAKAMMVAQGRGMLIYMPQEGRGIGLSNKVHAYCLQDQGADTVDANRVLGFEDDYRSYEPVLHILQHFHLSRIQLCTNNPRKIHLLTELGVEITARVPVLIPTQKHNQAYLDAKLHRMDHFLEHLAPAPSACAHETNGDDLDHHQHDGDVRIEQQTTHILVMVGSVLAMVVYLLVNSI